VVSHISRKTSEIWGTLRFVEKKRQNGPTGKLPGLRISSEKGKGRVIPLPATPSIKRTGGLAARPGSCRRVAQNLRKWEARNASVVIKVWVARSHAGAGTRRDVDCRRANDFGEGHPPLGRRMPDLDLVTADGPVALFTLLHDARPVLLNLGEPGSFDITPWADRVPLIDAKYAGAWQLPAIGAVTPPTAVLVRPDGYVAWVGDLTQVSLAVTLTTWFGPPTLA